jgi:4,5-dihydroxyphthalate decarboxylase
LKPKNFSFEFAAITPIYRAFAQMIRAQAYDVSEMAIATLLQAKAYGKPIVLLPVCVTARYQEAAVLCRAGSDIRGPADLAGRRVGVRSYAQTTGMWLRGVFAESHGVPASAIRWTTFEDAHVLEFKDPDFVARSDGDMTAMLRAGALDAVIYGNEVPEGAEFRTVFADPVQAGRDFQSRYGLMPVNHLLTVSRALADERPEDVRELVRLCGEAGFPMVGRAALDPAIDLARRFAAAQGMLPGALSLEDVWEGLPEGVI